MLVICMTRRSGQLNYKKPLKVSWNTSYVTVNVIEPEVLQAVESVPQIGLEGRLDGMWALQNRYLH
jgi:hypothetical protein